MVEVASLLIRGVELLSGQRADVRLAHGRIEDVGSLAPRSGERCIAAAGGLLLPGLHDHHLHLAATATARVSVRCGPPDVLDAAMLARALDRPGTDWLRGIGYHESVAGMLHRSWLDDVTGDRPVRIQHRGGRMWFLNSAAIARLLANSDGPPTGLDLASGQLFDADRWLREALESRPPPLNDLGTELSRLGITGVTDMGPANGTVEHAHVASEQARGALPQRVVLAGSAQLDAIEDSGWLARGPHKIHLHEANLPPYEEVVAAIIAAHEQGRGVAVHCVTELELVFALAALREAGPDCADRIEHAAVAPNALVSQIAEMGLCVAVQPLFVAERGDAYLRDVPAPDWPHLYRLRGFVEALRGDARAGRLRIRTQRAAPFDHVARHVPVRQRIGGQSFRRLGRGARAVRGGLATGAAVPGIIRRRLQAGARASAGVAAVDRGIEQFGQRRPDRLHLGPVGLGSRGFA